MKYSDATDHSSYNSQDSLISQASRSQNFASPTPFQSPLNYKAQDGQLFEIETLQTASEQIMRLNFNRTEFQLPPLDFAFSDDCPAFYISDGAADFEIL